jgi:hypothetical protein
MPNNSLSQQQRTFEIEERTQELLKPELKSKFISYRQNLTFPEDQRKQLNRLQSTYIEREAEKLAKCGIGVLFLSINKINNKSNNR